ncbi:MAG: 2-oxo acid dehydrogenase subunit E2 [Cyclobacteriaceae bacterium]|nr:2-oxo acid dehydrogenase subunit E2 [Cyclobacteriaceae bacterium]MCH8515907.1 2-oxo acid dehydrogenase subunit E2 [Cyclobacteriaceae bacterium]
MAIVEMVMPKMGESIMEGTILSWLKKEGDSIEEDESVLEVATDKVDTEVPALHAGVLKELLVKEGDVVEVGKPIALIETSANGETKAAPQDTSKDKPEENRLEVAQEKTTSEVTASNDELKNRSESGKFFSPLVLSIAKKEGISASELETISGTGVEGRVTKKDILAYLKTRGKVSTEKESSNSASSAPASTTAPSAPAAAVTGDYLPAPQKVHVSVNSNDEIIEMDRMRKMISQRMVDSKRISPHVTSFVEADVTNIVYWRNRVKQEFKQREGDNITFTPIFIEAMVKAIKDYPMINVQVDGDRIIKKGDINIGMAVALPSGNLIVPVIKNADQLNLVGLTKKVNELARKARNNKLSPDELQGGTFTVSNVGSFGNVMGTPIIMQPQVGIMAFGAVVKKPAVIETPTGDAIAIRHKMFLSHSYDHRVVDGSLGGMVVRRLADYLEKFDMKTTI